MPSTINGIGTWYYGKKNLQHSPGVCEFCRQSVDLETYETRLWFVVVFFPVIPLGKKQVLDSCPKCRRHRVVALSEWEKLRAEAIQQSVGQLEANRDDPETGLQMLSTLAGFRKTEEATKLARLLKTRHPDHAELQYTVGAWLEFAGHKDEAGECFRRSFELDAENRDYRRAYGLTLATEGRLEQAHEQLALFEPPSRHYEPATLLHLARESHAHGDHQRTVDVLRKVIRATPQVAKEKWIRRLIRDSEAAIGADESILPRRSLLKSKAFWIVTALLLVALGGSAASWLIAASRTVHIVNGTPAEITVSIDGSPAIRVAAFTQHEFRLGEGTHTWKLTEPPVIAGQGQFTLSSDFSARFSNNPVFVLDPGRMTIIVQEEAFYGLNPNNQEMTHRLHVGETFVSYPDIDLAFKPFPRQIKVSGGRASRTRVDALLGEPHAAIHFVSEELPASKSLAFCERHLTLNPADFNLLNTFFALASRHDQEQRLYQFLKAGANRIPIEVEWHRRLQSAMQRLNLFEETRAVYDRLVEQFPDDATALYLRGRIEPDLELAADYFDRSARAAPDSPWPYYSRAFGLTSVGNFEEARGFCQKAIDLDPENADYRRAMFLIRLALGELDQLEREQREEIRKSAIASTPNWRLMRVLAAKGNLEELATAQSVYALSRKTQLPSDPFDELLHSERFVRYCQRDFDKILKLSERVKNAPARSHQIFQALLELDRLEELDEAVLPDRITERGYLKLFLHLAWLRRGDEARADEWLEKALNDFRDGDPETKAIAAGFASERDTDLASRLIRISLQTEERMLVSLAAASRTSGPSRKQLIDLAETLNFDAGFPHHFIARTIEWLRKSE